MFFSIPQSALQLRATSTTSTMRNHSNYTEGSFSLQFPGNALLHSALALRTRITSVKHKQVKNKQKYLRTTAQSLQDHWMRQEAQDQHQQSMMTTLPTKNQPRQYCRSTTHTHQQQSPMNMLLFRLPGTSNTPESQTPTSQYLLINDLTPTPPIPSTPTLTRH